MTKAGVTFGIVQATIQALYWSHLPLVAAGLRLAPGAAMRLDIYAD
jgi:hypothetical protein